MTDASVTVQVAQQNFVAGLEVAEGSLPQTGCEAGGTHTLQVSWPPPPHCKNDSQAGHPRQGAAAADTAMLSPVDRNLDRQINP